MDSNNKENRINPTMSRINSSNLIETQRISDASRLTFKAGPMTRPVARSHMSATMSSASDTRDLIKDNDTLRKELERKDARNVNLTSEMQALRTSYSTLQREVRMLSGTFEKVNSDRQRLSSELIKCKEYKDKLEVQLSRLGDVQYLTSQADRFQTERDHMEMELGNFRSLLAAREDRIKALERDLEVFHRSIDVQAQYEGSMASAKFGGQASTGKAGTSEREAMKSLYYELGKRQTDAHSLAISLASSNQELVSLRDNLRSAVEGRGEALSDLERLRQYCSQLTQQSIKDKDEVVSLHEKHQNVKSLANRLQGQVEELSRQLAEERLLIEKERSEMNALKTVHEEFQQKSNFELKSLRSRVETLQNSLSQVDSVRTMTEKKLAGEWTKLSLEMEAMTEKSHRCDYIENQLEITHKKLHEVTRQKDEALAALAASTQGASMQLQNSTLTLEVDQAHSKILELMHDKEQSVMALQQTMDAARDLNARYQAEKSKRSQLDERLRVAEERTLQAERFADSLNKAREHVSTAVLDALQKERMKTAALESTIASLQRGISCPEPLKSSNNSLVQPPADPVDRSLPSIASQGGSKTISNELLRLRNEISRMEQMAPNIGGGISDDSTEKAQGAEI